MPGKPLNPPIRAAVLTVSDRCSRGEADDTAGPAVAAMCIELLSAEVAASACVPDETEAIRQAIEAWSNRDATDSAPAVDLILTTGGTGLSPRDVTPEATAAMLERRHPGLLELARLRCYEITPRTFLSRGEAGTRDQSLIINLPGSRRGATQMLAAMCDILPHAIATLRGVDEHPPGYGGAT